MNLVYIPLHSGSHEVVTDSTQICIPSNDMNSTMEYKLNKKAFQ